MFVSPTGLNDEDAMLRSDMDHDDPGSEQ
jgi:hypothetical protein